MPPFKVAKVEVIICSEDSVKRPWINFEAGAGWVKGIPVVPVCHTGMRPVDLPIPLNMLQGIEAKDSAGLQQLYELLAKQLGCTTPKPSFSGFIKKIEKFEQDYGVIRLIRGHVASLVRALPALRPLFEATALVRNATRQISTHEQSQILPALDGLQKMGSIQYSFASCMLMGTGGPLGGFINVVLSLQVMPAYVKYADEVMKGIP